MVYGLTLYICEYFTREYFNTTAPSNREFKNAKNAKIANPRNINPAKIKSHTVYLLTFIEFGIICHPTDLPRKHHRPSTQSSEDLELQEPVAKKLLHDYKALKRDQLVQDLSDLDSESDPEVIIKLLYGNALATISKLLQPHLKEVKEAAGRFHHLGLHHVAVGVDIIESADSIDSLLRRMSVTGMWDQTRFLRKAIASIPQSASDREVAEAILFHYDQHLAIYKRATLLKDAVPKESGTEEEARVPMESNELVPLEITSRKAFDSFSCEDCYKLQVRGLKRAYGIPEEKIICHEVKDGHSTTITFMIPHQYVHDVIQRSGQLDAVWILLELDIIEVHPWSVHLHSLCGLLPVTAEGKQALHCRPSWSDRGEGLV